MGWATPRGVEKTSKIAKKAYGNNWKRSTGFKNRVL
jgi:hypothetical protein